MGAALTPTGTPAAARVAIASRRAGGANKLLFDMGGRPMVVRAVETALAAGLGPVIAVTGRDAPEIGKIVKVAGAETVHNPD